MLLVGECWCWRRCLRVVVLLLFTLQMRLVVARPSHHRSPFRRHGSPRSSALAYSSQHDSGSVSPRWLTPCAGATTLHSSRSVDADASSSVTSLDGDVTSDMTSQHGRRRLLRRLARQMTRLADRVDRLKLRYVSTNSFY